MSAHPDPTAAIERRFPLVAIDPSTAVELLRPFTGGVAVQKLELLAGGHVNTNYVVTLERARVVLRIFVRGEGIFRKEVTLLERLLGMVPVPRVLYKSGPTKLLPYPYAVLEWIAGTPLNEMIASGVDAARDAADAITAALLRFRNQTASEWPAPLLIDSVHQSLFERGAARWLTPSIVERLWKLVRNNAASIETMSPHRSLVHGDFQNDNILLHRGGHQWHLGGVVDWEWAHEGNYLEDLGSLLRYDGLNATAFREALAAAHEQNGVALPELWMRAACIVDTAALCEKLTHPTHRGEVTHRAIRLIERCVHEYDR